MNAKLLALATVVAASLSFAHAEPPGPGPHGPGKDKPLPQWVKDLTPEQREKMKTARQKAMEDPQLKKMHEEMRSLQAQLRDDRSNAQLREQMHQKRKAVGEAMDQAMVKIDPSLKPIIDKRKAERQARMEKMAQKSKSKI